jgi:lipid II:glycine glycyltransferase (peptidoglycan interpeptide bridge formation enzyme)
MFYAPRGPVVASHDSPVLPILMRGADELVRKAGGFAIRIEPNVVDGDTAWVEAFRSLGYRATEHTNQWRSVWVLDIRPPEKDLLGEMKMTWRYNIGLAERKKVVIRYSSGDADLDMFYEMYTDTAKRQNFYLYPKRVLRDMLNLYTAENAVRNNTAEMVMMIAEFEGEPLAIITVARHGKWAWYMHSATGMKHRNRKANYLLQWHAITWAKSHGVEFYDFRGIPDILEPDQEMYGVYDFKQGFGGAVRRVIPTMDRVLNPLIYYPYSVSVDLRRRSAQRKAKQEAERKATLARAGQEPASEE